MKAPEKALFIQLRRIGDVLMCTPAIRAFHQTFPGCKLDFLTEMPEVLQGNPHLNSIIAVNRAKQTDILYQYKLISKIRHGEYDLVVDFFANPRSAYYSYFSRAITRLSYGFGHRRWAYNLIPPKPDRPIYAALDRLRLLETVGVNSDDPRLEFYPSLDDRLKIQSLIQDADGRPIISVSPVSRRDYRRWPLESFASLSDKLISKYKVQIIILAGPGEEAFAEKVASLMENKPLVPHVKSLGMLGALFEKVSLHIGNDNGPKHIAVASGAPTFTIFGSDSPVSWTYPDYARHHWVQAKEFCDKRDQAKHHCDAECVGRIPVDVVWEKVNDMIGSLPSFESAIKKA